MKKRKRFQDKVDAKKLGFQPIISKHIPGEKAEDRHARRLSQNLSYEDEWHEWCRLNGIYLTITNQGHHWKFMHKAGTAEWWPSSAKLVLNYRYRDGIHAHDAGQVRPILLRFFGIDPT